jgi:chaperonin cofactor prefoldin
VKRLEEEFRSGNDEVQKVRQNVTKLDVIVKLSARETADQFNFIRSNLSTEISQVRNQISKVNNEFSALESKLSAQDQVPA